MNDGSEYMMAIAFPRLLLAWTAAVLMSSLFGATLVMSVLSWGFYDWSNAYAPAWERSVSHTSAGLLVAVNALGVFLAPFALLVSKTERVTFWVVKPIWIKGIWLLAIGAGLLSTVSLMVWVAGRPEVAEVLDGWWILFLFTSALFHVTGIIMLGRYWRSSDRSSEEGVAWIRLVRSLHLLIFVRTVLVISVFGVVGVDIFGMLAGPVDDTPQTLEFLFWVELVLSLVLVSSSTMPRLGFGFRIIGLAIVVFASASALVYAAFGSENWYPVWLTAVPLLLVLYGMWRHSTSMRGKDV